MLERYGLLFPKNGLLATFQAVLKTGAEAYEALSQLPDVRLPEGYAPDRLLEFNASDHPFSGTSQPEENFVIVQYTKDGQRIHVSHYFGEDRSYERAMINGGGVLFYKGRCLGLNGEVDASVTADFLEAHGKHSSKIRNAQRFLKTCDPEGVI